MAGIRFGTDGWRAIIGWDFTADNVRACARGVATYLQKSGMASRGLVVGYDTRFASEDFAAEVAQVTTAAGIPTFLCDMPAPTPVVSYNIVHLGAGGGVVITASHNPPQWNGFKYKPDYGGSASPEVVEALEGEIAVALKAQVARIPLAQARERGLLTEIDPAPPYMAHLGTLVDIPAIRDSGLSVVVDAMYGAGAGYLPRLLEGGALPLTELHGERNPSFPGMAQPEPVAHNLTALSECVAAQGAHVGIALDGDADRLGIVDEKGQYISTLQVFALLALYFLEVRGQKGPLVKSVTMSSMIYRLGELFDIPVYETPVGFKYIGPVMTERDALAGGEESGGYSFKGHIPERDGILSGLYFLDMMVKTGKSPSELLDHLFSRVGPHYYDRIDVSFASDRRAEIQERVASQRPDTLAGVPVTDRDEVDGTRLHLEGGAWALVRFSGTEPLLRIYSEAESPERVHRILEEVRALVGV
ncbi:MAG: phosphoglucomutase/phosphomannomutase family protein [Chloroflexi bacterium]|nr:phosphoglucomutase/phosphomannomutase family protein [Chloroflexota bacterium]MCZ6891839.1 phosphoglucomutase/phosphomannomutase family protein [Chloroflexota bacterium]